jgi:hypothetical protein
MKCIFDCDFDICEWFKFKNGVDCGGWVCWWFWKLG